MLGFFAMLLLNSAQASAAGETTEPPPVATVETTHTLDTRINSLQNTKDCIHNAKSKADVDQCRRSIEIKRERIKVH